MIWAGAGRAFQVSRPTGSLDHSRARELDRLWVSMLPGESPPRRLGCGRIRTGAAWVESDRGRKKYHRVFDRDSDCGYVFVTGITYHVLGHRYVRPGNAGSDLAQSHSQGAGPGLAITPCCPN
jgi:hypothetical protein